jgi:hypothetical protein
MMDPVTLTVVGMGMSAASGIMGASAAEQAGESQRSMSLYKQVVALRNAEYAEDQATYDERAGEVNRMKVARQRLGMAAEAKTRPSNLDPNSGSMRQIHDSNIILGEQDEAMARNDAQLAAWKSRVVAQQYTMQGGLDQMSADNAMKEANAKANATLLTAGGQMVGQGLTAFRTGVFATPGGAPGGAVGPDPAVVTASNLYKSDNYAMPGDPTGATFTDA